MFCELFYGRIPKKWGILELRQVEKRDENFQQNVRFLIGEYSCLQSIFSEKCQNLTANCDKKSTLVTQKIQLKIKTNRKHLTEFRFQFRKEIRIFAQNLYSK